MKISQKLLTFFQISNDPFSAQEALKFIIGAFLCVGLFSAVMDYGSQTYFLLREGKNPLLHEIDLTTQGLQTGEKIPEGFVQITGYPSQQISHEWIDTTGETLDSLTSYYYVLLSNPNKKPKKLIIVQREDYESSNSTFKVEQPDMQKKKTIQGVADYYAHAEKSAIDFFKKTYSINDPEKITIVQEGSHPTEKTIWYFTVAFTLLLFGVFLLLRWIWIVKKQY